MAKRNKYGIAYVMYAVILLLFGVLLWLFRQGKAADYFESAVRFDNALVDLLVVNGISDHNIVSQLRRERKAGVSIWVEYEREIALPDGITPGTIVARVEELALRSNLRILNKKVDESTGSIVVWVGTAVFSRLSLSAYVKEPVTKTVGPLVAIVLDDAGSNKNLTPFFDLGIPLTFAVMPFEYHSKTVAQELQRRNMPFLLHLPLEPEGYPGVNPGKRALLVNMSSKEITEAFNSSMADVPGVFGVSNHMGSRFSADEGKMGYLLQAVGKKGLCYFDSYTTPKTRARKAAQAQRVPCLANDLFIDLQDTPKFMSAQMEKVLKRAKKTGRCIAIAHVHKKNIIPVLKEYIPRFKAEGVTFVFLKEMYGDGSK